jgi:hypothetical protein
LQVGGGHNIRISGLRFWADTFGLGAAQQQDNFNLSSCVNCIFDHNSYHGAIDGIIDVTPGIGDSIVDVTIQNVIWAHTYKVGGLMDQGPGEGPLDRFTWYRSLSVDARQRRPDVNPNDTIGMIRMEKIENVDHNTMEADRFGRVNGRVEIDHLDNFASQRTGKSYVDVWVLHECEDFNAPPCTGLDNRYPDVIYVDGNTTRDGSKTDYAMWRLETGAAIPDSVKRSARIAAAGWPAKYDAYSAATSMDSATAEAVSDGAGAHFNLSCGGTALDNRDALDDTTAYKFTKAQGLATTPAAITDFYPSGYPTLAAGTPCTDTDGDGLPDAFETWSGVADADSLIAGYLAIEHYLNGDSAYLAEALSGSSYPPTYRPGGPGGAKHFARRIPAKDTTPFFDTLTTYPIPTAPESIPTGTTGRYFVDTGTTARMIYITCDSTLTGAAVMDSAPWRDTTIAMGLNPTQIMGLSISGCP